MGFILTTLFIFLTCFHLLYGHLAKPSITLHNGHISLYDELFQHDLRGSIQPGMPYSLDITLVDTQSHDYLLQHCLYNGQSRFIDNYGCFLGDRIFVKKWETTQYNIPGAIKRTIIHFVPKEPVVHIECRIKIIECCGCAEQACERKPLLSEFNDIQETLILSVGGDRPVAGGGIIGSNGNIGAAQARSFTGIPCSNGSGQVNIRGADCCVRRAFGIRKSRGKRSNCDGTKSG
ncbi:hypothetical protein QR680_002074 [Steinernema hermaphroditum]|uniref:ZP domain-containing protein n=1 Tax=Steinernema hermaphroditum TaxID=289476 RepID=A0AA39H2U8_9BILA|nr:hypothetical protein QR680_002074 [Steinernema hermaphroditum]